MGGLLDSTNVCQPILTGITTVGFDHTAMLEEQLKKLPFKKQALSNEYPSCNRQNKKDALKVIQEQEKWKQHIINFLKIIVCPKYLLVKMSKSVIHLSKQIININII